MKKLLFILLVIFASCEKDSSCWECTTTIITQCNGYASDKMTITSTPCDLSENDIRAYEASSNTTVTTNSGGITCTARSTCKCRKK